jgi:hypothetical protein
MGALIERLLLRRVLLRDNPIEVFFRIPQLCAKLSGCSSADAARLSYQNPSLTSFVQFGSGRLLNS